jgi:glycerol-3-phosphate dehydrogenase subunit C
VGVAAVLVLEHNGYEVIVPPQGCCGLPLLSNGEFDTAHKGHDSNLARLASFARGGFAIVGTSTSCILTLQEEAPELLDIHSDDQAVLGASTYDIFEWLRDLHAKGELKTDFKPLKMVMPYHQPCQYRAHNIGAPSEAIMRLIPDLDIRNGHLRCCGIAGTYGYKTEKYDIAMAVGKELFDYVNSQGAAVEMTACDSETCRWQLQHGTNLPSRHPIEIVATAYGLYDLVKRKPTVG